MKPHPHPVSTIRKAAALVALAAVAATGCSTPPSPSPAPAPTLLPVSVVVDTETATATLEPTATSRATSTPSPTNSPLPSATATSVPATATAKPTAPAPKATATALASAPSAAPTSAQGVTAASVLPAPLPAGVSEQDRDNAEQHTLDLITAQRAAAGLAPLKRDETLMAIARARVDDMVDRHYTGHTDPVTGVGLGKAMMRAAGYTSGFMAENWYGHAQGPGAAADAAMAWFMTDPPHAANILSPNFVGVGVGIAYNGQLWLLVQDFAGK